MIQRARSAFVRSILVLGLATPALAQDAPAPDAKPEARGGIEEIVVTARKREESVQDIPVAVTAFSGADLENINIDDVADVQFAVPNVTYTKTNFSGSGSFSIRGIGSLVVAASGDPGTGVHINEAPFSGARIFETEFYDVDRVEVLRGPQGTLFGRNAPAGAINIYTRRPYTEDWGGYVEASYGDFEHKKVRAGLNIPIGEHLAARVAGYWFDRDGITDNLTTGNEIDDRDLYAGRVSLTGVWDRFDFNWMGSWFDEDDKRARIQKQACTRDAGVWPATIGCLPNTLGTDALNADATLGFELGLLIDQLVAAGLPYQRVLTGDIGLFNAAPTGLNDIFATGPTAGGPAGVPTGNYANSVNPKGLRDVAATSDPLYEAREFMSTLNMNFQITDEFTLTSVTGYHNYETKSETDYFWATPSENFETPIFADFPDNPRGGQLYASETPFDRAYNDVWVWTQELRVSSSLSGPWNFTVGALYTEAEVETGYYVYSVALEHFWRLPGDPFGFCGGNPGGCYELQPASSYFLNETDPHELESWALFGEVYYDLFDRTRLTVGVRYTDEEKTTTSRGGNLFVCNNPPACDLDPYQTQNEEWQKVNFKLSVDHHLDLPMADDSLLYATVSTGYKGGGFNPPTATNVPGSTVPEAFDEEDITAYEVGFKGIIADQFLLNLTGFFYDYEGFQISKIVNRTAINENIDATIFGVELESLWQVTENIRLDLNVSWIDTEIDSGESIDPSNPVGGVPGFVAVKDRSLNGQNAACNTSTNPTCNPIPGPDFVIDGFPQQLDGRELPNTPEWTLKFGGQYTLPVWRGWEATMRADYYWQDDMYGRIFNENRDEIDSWSQIDAQVRLMNPDSSWMVELWGKNLEDNDEVTGHYLTDATSGNFTNLFILEPRTYGLTVRYTFGDG